MRTGIPGLIYRRNLGKNAGGAALIVFAVMLVVSAFVIVLRFLLYVLPFLWKFLTWAGLTLYDFGLRGVDRVKVWRSQPVGSPGNSKGISHIRDTVIGIAVCGTVYLVISHRILKAPTTPASSAVTTAPEKIIRKEPHVAAPIKSARHRIINASPPATASAKNDTGESEVGALAPPSPISPPENDDLVDVRAADAVAATRIDTYCTGATAQATSRKAEISARCRHDEAAAWTRLVLQNEFPSLAPGIRETCTSPPFPQSFVAEETCVRYETNSDPAH